MKLAYDIGANKGDSTARYLAMGYKVIAVEASPALYAELCQRFHVELEARTLTLLNIGVGNREGTLPFYISPNHLWSSFNRAMAERGGQAQTVQIPMRKLADVIREHGAPEFVKIDVEGADYECLQSLATLDTLPQYLSCEADKVMGWNQIALLTKMGYANFALINQVNYLPCDIPRAGTLASVKWAVRQWLRLSLRGSFVHSVLRRLKDSRGGSNTSAAHSAGPTPMEFKGTWHTPSSFTWLWENVYWSGMIDSVWWDVHAKRT